MLIDSQCSFLLLRISLGSYMKQQPIPHVLVSMVQLMKTAALISRIFSFCYNWVKWISPFEIGFALIYFCVSFFPCFKCAHPLSTHWCCDRLYSYFYIILLVLQFMLCMIKCKTYSCCLERLIHYYYDVPRWQVLYIWSHNYLQRVNIFCSEKITKDVGFFENAWRKNVTPWVDVTFLPIWHHNENVWTTNHNKQNKCC